MSEKRFTKSGIAIDFGATKISISEIIKGNYKKTITEPTSLTSGSTASTDVTCNGADDGTATVVNVIGGTPFTVGDPYLYLWDDPLAQTTLIATGLSPGTYACTVTDSNVSLILI